MVHSLQQESLLTSTQRGEKSQTIFNVASKPQGILVYESHLKNRAGKRGRSGGVNEQRCDDTITKCHDFQARATHCTDCMHPPLLHACINAKRGRRHRPTGWTHCHRLVLRAAPTVHTAAFPLGVASARNATGNLTCHAFFLRGFGITRRPQMCQNAFKHFQKACTASVAPSSKLPSSYTPTEAYATGGATGLMPCAGL